MKETRASTCFLISWLGLLEAHRPLGTKSQKNAHDQRWLRGLGRNMSIVTRWRHDWRVLHEMSVMTWTARSIKRQHWQLLQQVGA